MQVRVVGAHNLETRDTRHTCFLIDGTVAIDAGSLAAALDDEQRARLSAVLATHMHFDHTRDIPTLALAAHEMGRQLSVYSLPSTLEGVRRHLLDGEVYPDLTRPLNGAPAACRFEEIAPGAPFAVGALQVSALPVVHTVPSVGFILWEQRGDCIAISGDTSGGLAGFFSHEPKPQVLFVEVTFPNRLDHRARVTGHLTPTTLAKEVQAAQARGLPVPRIVAVHIGYFFRHEILAELAQLPANAGVDVTVGHEEMQIDTRSSQLVLSRGVAT